MPASEALALERLLAGTGFAEKPANVALLSGPGAKLQLASALPSRAAVVAHLPTGIDPLDRLISGGLPRGLNPMRDAAAIEGFAWLVRNRRAAPHRERPFR